MPNFRIHEEVAYIFTRKHPEFDKKEFYLGVVAPDAPNLEGFAPKEERWMAHQRNKDYNIWKDNIVFISLMSHPSFFFRSKTF